MYNLIIFENETEELFENLDKQTFENCKLYKKQ